MLAAHREEITRISVHVAHDVATYLNNRKRRELARLEDQGGMLIQIDGREGVMPEFLQVEAFDANSREVRFTSPELEVTRNTR